VSPGEIGRPHCLSIEDLGSAFWQPRSAISAFTFLPLAP